MQPAEHDRSHLRECSCPVPEPTEDRLNGQPKCVRCGFVLGEGWLSSDDRLGEFFDRLAEWPGQTLDAFRSHCFRRERAGRSRFKLKYLGRDNSTEADEEAVDGSMYCFLETLKNRRLRRPEEDDVDLYHAAHSFAQAYTHLARYRDRQRGHP